MRKFKSYIDDYVLKLRINFRYIDFFDKVHDGCLTDLFLVGDRLVHSFIISDTDIFISSIITSGLCFDCTDGETFNLYMCSIDELDLYLRIIESVVRNNISDFTLRYDRDKVKRFFDGT